MTPHDVQRALRRHTQRRDQEDKHADIVAALIIVQELPFFTRLKLRRIARVFAKEARKMRDARDLAK